MNHSARNVLVLRLSAFGDVLHTLPAVAALRASLDPDVRIGWLVEEPYAELVRMVSAADDLFIARTKRWRNSPFAGDTRREIGRLRRQLREFSSAGTSIDFQGLVKSAVFGWIAGASERFGFDRHAVRERASLLFTNRRASVSPGHVVELNLQLARMAGADREGAPLDFSRFEQDPTGRLAELAAGKVIIINPGAAGPGKSWGAERFARLADLLPPELEPYVVWGPGERHLAERIAASSRAEIAPATTLRELAFLLRRARLLISGDSGPLHLASALGTPVVGLYGPTDPFRNGPYGQPGHWVETWSASQSIDDVGVQSVVRKVNEALGEQGLRIQN